MIDKTDLHELFCQHYSEMIHLAKTLLYDDEEAEDAVQNVFVRLIESDIQPADDRVKAYLMTAVRNGCINRIKQKTLTERFHKLYSMDVESDWQHAEQRMAMLENICHYADNNLHEPHRTIFQLRFEEGLKLAVVMETNPNIIRLMEMLETPEAYSEQEIRDIINSNDETREAYRVMVASKQGYIHKQMAMIHILRSIQHSHLVLD